jgi:dTMP kinase
MWKNSFSSHSPFHRQFLRNRIQTVSLFTGKGAHFAAALFYMVDVIRSILFYSWRKYDYVIFVRYLMGTAYLPSPIHKIAYNFFAIWVPKSNFMFFLDVRPEEAYKRIMHTRKRLEMFESLGELEKIRRKALSLAFMGSWKIVDANKPINDVHEKIIGTLKLSEKKV